MCIQLTVFPCLKSGGMITMTVSPTQMFSITVSTVSSQMTFPVLSSLTVTLLAPDTVQTVPATSDPDTKQPGRGEETERLVLTLHRREEEVEGEVWGLQGRQRTAAPRWVLSLKVRRVEVLWRRLRERGVVREVGPQSARQRPNSAQPECL